MTKDVLVRVKGTQFMDDENDVIEMITAGTFNEKNGKKYLIYDETIVEGGDQTHNIVKIWPDKVEVTKRGLVDTHMTFECGKKHMCNYMTPVGLIILGITTSALEVEEDETSMGIVISYALEMNGEYISGCGLEIYARDMESFLVAVNAVVPFLCYITFGYVMKIKGVVKEDFLQQLNKMVFKVFYPFMTFYNIYKADASSLPRPVMLIFCGVSILVLEVILVLTVPRLVKENPRRGVIIQAIYRSNFVLFGLPLTVSVFGDVASSVAAMVVTVVITIYNTTSVVILEMFNSEGKTDVKTILVNVVKNPLLQGAMVGLVFFFLGIHVPKSLLTPIAAFADATSPVALFVLGGTLHFNAIRGNLKYLVPALSLKLLVLPAVMLALGYAFGLRDLELFLLVAIYGTPVAAASYPMAQNMGGDGELAGQFVVISTVVAVGTLFGWIFFMKSVGLI